MNAVIKGAKAGSGDTRKPVVAVDSAQSKTYIKILYGLSEGEIEGLANGLKSVYLEETPLENPNGGKNFENITSFFRYGTNDQEHIEGFPDVSSETAISVELKSETPWVKAVSNTDLDAVSIRLKWGPIRQTNPDNGDVNGYTIKYAIDLQTDGGTWKEVLNTQLSDKTSANYERSHRIELPKANTGWTIRVRRLTQNSESEYISDKMYVEAFTEIIDLKLNYPNTALLGLHYDAETFSNVAKIAVDLKGVRIKVPSNYDPVSRKYIGLWDGTFKRTYTNNPAWIYYDICTSKRYALGDRLTQAMIDKWSLYRLAQYCDQEVDDGKGGKEPRFTCNVYLQSTEDAYAILTKLAGVFRAISYWDGNSIVCDADLPQDTYFTYTRANVIDGNFEYTGTRARDRHNVAKVAWDNPKNHYKTEYVFVRAEDAIAQLGIRIIEIDAWGCTSEGQAQRAGHWALKSEQLETRTVTFKVGLDGHIPQPGKVIEIADELFAGRANGGRIAAVSANLRTITIDRDHVVCRAGDRLVVNGENGKAQARIVSSVSGRAITVTTAFDSVAAQNVWIVDAQDLKTMKFRVMSIVQNEQHQFTITALQYEESKHDLIDYSAFIQDRPISIINPTIQDPVKSVTITAETMVQQGLSVETMVIAWDQATGATQYQVEWRKDDGSWLKLPITGSNSVEVQGIYAGKYQARVTAINAFESASLPTYSVLTELKGKQGLPPALANLSAEGILFGYKMSWRFPVIGALDTAYTEIEISSTANGANATQLGLFAYPTDTHIIQGMQPNLTRYFRGRLIDRIGNIGPWSNRVSATTSADASAVLDILSGQIGESQLHQDLQTKIDKIDTIAGLDGDIGNLIDNITAVQTEVDQLNNSFALERQDRINDVKSLNDGLSKEALDRQAAIQQETLARTSAINAETQARNDAILKEATARSTAISTEKTERVNADSILSSRIDTVSASNGANTVAIQQEVTARVEADKAIGQRIDSLVVEVDDNAAAINQEATARADADSANARLIETVRAESIQNNKDVKALITEESNARVDADKAISERVTGVEVITNPEMLGSTDDLIGSDRGYVGAWSILTAVQEGDLYQAQRTDLLTVSVNNNAANILTEQTARVSADEALSTRIDSLSANFNDNTASVNQKISALADADKALTQDISNMSARVGNNEANIISESKARADGDNANAKALTDYRTANDAALANVRQSAESAVTGTTANTKAVQALDSRVQIAEGDASTAKTNAASALSKAETASTQTGSAASLAQQATATANQASDTADKANQTAATALSTANVAATKSEANAKSIDAITVELGTKATTGALSQTNAKVSEHENKISANTEKLDGVYAQVNPKLIGSTDDLIGSEQGYAGVWSLQSAMIEGDMAQAKRTDQVSAQMAENDALYLQKIETLADQDKALGQRIDTLQAQVGDDLQQSIATIQAEMNVLADTDKALGQRVDTLQTKFETDLSSNLATIQSELDVLSNADQALAKRVDTVQASANSAQSTADQAVLDAAAKSLEAEQAAKTYADAKAKAEADAAKAAASNDATVKANAAESAAKLAAALDAKEKADAAQKAAEAKAATAQATANDALSKANQANTNLATLKTEFEAVATESNATAKQVNTLQTTVNGNTASIQEVNESVDGLYAQKFTKIDVNGKVIGWGGANDGVEGKFIFNVDALAIGSGNSTGYYPFIFRTTPFTDPLTGTVFPVSAYLKSAMMDYQSVKTSHIEDLAVKTAKIDDLAVTNAKIANLSVDVAKIADASISSAKIQNLAVNTGHIADLSVNSLKIGDQAVTVGVSGTGISTLSIITSGGRVMIDVGVVINHFYRTGSANLNVPGQMRLKRNDVVIYTYNIYPTASVSNEEAVVFNYCSSLSPITDYPPAGTNIYSIEITSGSTMINNWIVPDLNSWINRNNITIRLLEIKK